MSSDTEIGLERIYGHVIRCIVFSQCSLAAVFGLALNRLKVLGLPVHREKLPMFNGSVVEQLHYLLQFNSFVTNRPPMRLALECFIREQFISPNGFTKAGDTAPKAQQC